MSLATIDEILAAVDRWFEERIKRGPIANHVAAYNQAFKAMPELKDRLCLLVTGEPMQQPVAPEPEPEAELRKAEEPLELDEEAPAEADTDEHAPEPESDPEA